MPAGPAQLALDGSIDAPDLGAAHAYAPDSALGEIERITWAHRLRLAGRHNGIALEADRARLRAVRERTYERDSDDHRAAERRTKWHRDRSRGQAQRFHSHRGCGQALLVQRCSRCAHEGAALAGCGVVRLCVRCRDRRASHRRAQLWRAVAVARDRAAKSGRLRRKRHGGAWAEWHLVLTLPDQRIGSVERRIAVAFDAWRSFSRQVAAYGRGLPLPSALAHLDRLSAIALRNKPAAAARAYRRLARGFAGGAGQYYARTFEWTPGADGRGHPHFHVWRLGPKISRALLRAMWGAALESAGVPIRWDSDPLINEGRANLEWTIYETHKGAASIKQTRLIHRSAAGHVLGYAEGWAVSEIGKHGEPSATPPTMARVYMALEGRRHVQASAGLLALGRIVCRCPACFASGSLVVELVSWRSRAYYDVQVKHGLHPGRPPPYVLDVLARTVVPAACRSVARVA